MNIHNGRRYDNNNNNNIHHNKILGRAFSALVDPNRTGAVHFSNLLLLLSQYQHISSLPPLCMALNL